LNLLIVFLVFIIGILRLYIESSNTTMIRFPKDLYITNVLITNVIYISGITVEFIHSKLFDKSNSLRRIEKKYFIAAIVILIAFSAFGMI